MRTMFISLVLIWSLAQLASANDPVASTRFLPEGCGDIYKCYVPAICLPADDQETADMTKLEQKKVSEVTGNKKITSDCPALIKFHSFGPYWAHVSIESFQESSIINSIEFHLNGDGGIQKAKFLCSIEDKKLIGKYGRIINNNVAFSNKFVNDKIIETDKINCAFNVKQRKVAGYDVFSNPTDEDKVIFKVNTKSTKQGKYNIYKIRCDPSTFDFTEVDDNEKIYEKVEYKFKENKLKCPDKMKIEFRKEINGRMTEYDEIDKFMCKDASFMVKGVKATAPIEDNDGDTPDEYQFLHEEDLYIRCVAEVRFQCDYNLKATQNGPSPELTPAKYDTNEPTILKCPDDKPHLIIEDSGEDPILKAKFECRKSGSLAYWTVATPDKRTIIFTKEGPAAYCSETVKCEIFSTISENAVTEGYVSRENEPKCFDATGTLMIDKKKVTNSRCDGKDGKFKYTAGGEEKVIDANTKFICDYPKETKKADAQNKKNKENITNGIFGAAGGCLFIVLAGIGICAFLTIRRKRKDNQFLVDYRNAENLNWGSKSEKEAAKMALKQKNKNLSSSQMSDNNEGIFDKWNDLIKCVIHTYQTTAFTREELVVFTKKIRTDVAGKNVNEYAGIKSNEKKVVYEDTTVEAHKQVYKDGANRIKGGLAAGIEQRTKKNKDKEIADKKKKEREAGKK